MAARSSSVSLVQLRSRLGHRRTALVDGDRLRLLDAVDTVYELALEAIRRRATLSEVAADRVGGEEEAYDEVEAEQRLLPPLDHPDAAHCVVSGTGLTHLGSASSRDSMHHRLAPRDATDSMKMFEWGVEGGKPAPGCVGVQPEWFYKGDGDAVAPPGGRLWRPWFAEDASEEAELVGLYVIDDDGRPYRLGFALGNELSDHVMEKRNYLYLAHSKLRSCSFGPELRSGALPDDVRGEVAIRRGDCVVWQREMLTGEANMAHSIANLEHHHFKYEAFRRPGDVHVHFFGASVLSYSEGVAVEDGDVFVLSAPGFGRALRNPIVFESQTERLQLVMPL